MPITLDGTGSISGLSATGISAVQNLPATGTITTLTTTTISDGTNSTSATNCIQGSAKAWVNFNGTGTVAIRASYNVSSITDNGTGDYTVNFTNALSDANYCAVVTNVGFQNGDTRRNSVIAGNESTGAQTMTTTQLRVNVGNPASLSLSDNAVMCVSVFR